ncbi:MAG: response regulator, partial [Pseudomonadales bacterium]|nr:response regulator [Pseudomonadales bacterium]
CGDPIRLRQIITSLVSTAIKYTEQGDILIQTSYSNKSKNLIQFRIKDTGTGIPKELVEQLFLDFEKAGNDIAAEFGHAGLGLAIAKQLVEMMGGTIGAKTSAGKGSSVWFTIPLQPQPNITTYDQHYDTSLEGLKILIVDDNASCRMVIEQQTSSWGMRVTSAINGKHALAILRTQANLMEPFDIVVLDHNMPGMNGMELAAKVREDGLITHDILVIMMTGLGISPNATSARNSGIRRVLTKPVSGKLLRITLAEELSHMRKALGNKKTGNIQKFRQRAKVLVAEDHHLSQKVIRGMLNKLGVDIETVDNGEKAVRAVKAEKYDLILMDYEMPIKNGFDATIEIRRWEKENDLDEIPIIALTAHIMDEHKEQSLQCGMNAHLTKPIELVELQDTLVRWTRVELPEPESTL